MNTLESFVQLFGDLAMPVSLLVILFVFIFFIIRPFFARLFDPERMRDIQAQEMAQELAKKKREKAIAEKEKAAQAEKEFNPTYTSSGDISTNSNMKGEKSPGSE